MPPRKSSKKQQPKKQSSGNGVLTCYFCKYYQESPKISEDGMKRWCECIAETITVNKVACKFAEPAHRIWCHVYSSGTGGRCLVNLCKTRLQKCHHAEGTCVFKVELSTLFQATNINNMRTGFKRVSAAPVVAPAPAPKPAFKRIMK